MKAREPKQERGKLTREKLLGGGKKLFSKYSYHNVHAGDIAKEAGVAVGSFYAYFNNKRDLIIALSEEYVRDAKYRIFSLIQDDSLKVDNIDLENIIYNLLKAAISVHKESSAFLSELIRMSFNDIKIKEQLDKLNIQIIHVLEENIRKLNNRIPDKQIKALAYVLYYASEGVVHQIMLNPGEINEKKAAKILAGIFSPYIKKEILGKEFPI